MSAENIAVGRRIYEGWAGCEDVESLSAPARALAPTLALAIAEPGVALR
jgi:hypothetical protein